MPEKEGAEEKTTKSVVNKKQKQMMGEEGYDIARDMGRVRPSKDKKDATTMPPSKEMEKTRKVNKGPSALDIVKKKYKGQIMDVKKEELDLTQVAEAFGGYIIEAPVDSQGNITPKPGEEDKTKKLIKKAKQDVKSADQAAKVSQARRKLKINTTEKPKKVTNRMAKTIAGQDIEKMTGDKFVAGPNLENLGKSKKPKKIKLGEFPGAGPVKISNIKDKPTPKPRVFSYMRKISPEAQKKVDAVKKQIEIKNIIKPDRRLKSSRVATSSPEFGKPKIPSTKKSSVKLTKPSDVELPKSFKDFSSKLKSLKADIKQTKTKVKQLPKPNPKVTSNYTSDPDLSRMSDADQKKYKEIKATTPKGGIPDWMKQIDKKRKEIQQQPYQKGIKPAFKRAVLTKGKGVRGLASKVIRNPVGTAIAAGVARDSFRMPQLPPMPKLQGGKVGRRTAG